MDAATTIPSELLLEQAFESLDDAVLIVTPSDRRIIVANRAVQEVFGYPPAALVGRTSERLHVDRSHFLRFGRETMVALERAGVHRRHYVMRRRDGRVFPTAHVITKIHDATGRWVAVVSLVRDLTLWEEAREQLVRAETRLRDMTGRYQTLIEQLPAVTYTARQGPVPGATLYVSPQVETMLGFTPAEWLDPPDRWARQLHPDDRERVLRLLGDGDDVSDVVQAEYRLLSKSGEVVWVDDRAAFAGHDVGGEGLIQGVMFDITARKDAERRLQESLAQYQMLLDGANEAIVLIQDGRVRLVNRRAEEWSGYRREELIGTQFLEHVDPAQRELVARHYADRMAGREAPLQYDLRMRARGGRLVWLQANLVRVDWQGRAGVLAFLSDIESRVVAEQRLDHLAAHDALTGLPNRGSFLEQAGLVITESRAQGCSCAVLALDVDRFQLINETEGHERGDAALRLIAEGIHSALRRGDVVARLAGDEFGVLLGGLREPGDLDLVLTKLQRHFEQARARGGLPYLTLSAGVAQYPRDGDDPTALLQKADIALNHAQTAGGNTLRHYSDDMSEQAARRFTVRMGLERALAEEQWRLHYQPKVDLAGGRVTGVEALLRWAHPERGLVLPGEFVEALEDTGLIIPVGEWVIREACRQHRRWREARGLDLTVSVNASARQWLSPGFAERVVAILEDEGVAGGAIEVEVTESIHLHDPAGAGAVARALQAHGIRVALDDFGTGYSALGYLRSYAFDTLKMDRVFVAEIEQDPRVASIARAILELGRSLGMTVVAEGVETDSQVALLRRLGCPQIQGFHVSPPVPADAFAALAAGGPVLSAVAD